ncbi:hypothetical protein [Sutterella sp.]|uniref:hypothetical protein n=1 Tax=Sutterella sp. TaxID=1981025 RepID=UPI0026DF577B|nr:hypothetical protein [Sutterella sp.]MDO5532736.1 hypothetical protein [Sutterella sp.]
MKPFDPDLLLPETVPVTDESLRNFRENLVRLPIGAIEAIRERSEDALEVYARRRPEGADHYFRGLEHLRDRVWAPMREFLKSTARASRGNADAFFWNFEVQMRLLVTSAWAVDKVSGHVCGTASEDEAWWRGLTTDWLVDHFEPWCMWLSLNYAPGHDQGGVFCGFDGDADGLRFFMAFVRREDLFHPYEFFEFPVVPGRPISSLWENWVWNPPWKELLVAAYTAHPGAESAEAFSEDLTKTGLLLAQTLIPDICALLEDDLVLEQRLGMWRHTFEIDLDRRTSTRHDTLFVKRRTDMTTDETVAALGAQKYVWYECGLDLPEKSERN